MLLSTSFKGVKLDQDFAHHYNKNPEQGLILLCDGIGQYEESGEVAKLVVEEFFFYEQEKNIEDIQQFIYKVAENIKRKKIIGGTTFINAIIKRQEIYLSYLGNGGVIHCAGDFNETASDSCPYRYSEILLPHVNKNGSLTRHLSFNSNKEELQLSKVNLTLNNPKGDILLFYTDGINTIEESFILKDNEGRFWRKEATSIQLILELIHAFLLGEAQDAVKNDFGIFNRKILNELKEKDLLEDDASLGIYMTDQVLEYYRALKKETNE